MAIDDWRIHRRIGMSDGLFARAVARELGRTIPEEEARAVQARHGELFREPFSRASRAAGRLRAAGRAARSGSHARHGEITRLPCG
jgi:hypothetical protein